MDFDPRPVSPFEVETNASELYAEEAAETRELETERIVLPAPSIEQGGAVPSAPSAPPLKSILDDERVAHVAAAIGVACWSIAGTALRLEIGRCLLRHGFLTTYTTFGANCVGCFLMGFIEATANIQTQSRRFPWIFRSLLAGFCGSLTTFSSWMLDTVGRDTAALAFGELLSGLTIPFVFLLWGHDTVSMLRAVTGSTRGRRVSLSTSLAGGHSCRQLHLANIVFLALSVVMAVVIPIAVEVAVSRGLLDVSLIDRRSVIFAPLGAVPRYVLGHLLNGTGRFWRLPVGTFTANLIAVLLMGITDYYFRHEGNVWCKIVMNGLCGSLSTVSSFINEIVAMYSLGHRRSAYIYAAASVAVSAAIMAVCRRVLS
ncbi:hypothetical protein TRSC58_01070 [Trypanosoma rangeli SC58]|uniref:CrcB-like protein n=1 Tax=Trypanosoma rangeli SC58 TaxID=429131 RepID=A0A061J8G0_TRYRA|nr:hypothetical protein TRSC58_01070 [Trypanosoma rangeli SC58]